MARPARHRAPRRVGAALRRAGQATLAGTASLAAVGLTAPSASADGHNVWDRVAECESSGRWDINTGNGYYGGLQFYQPTWVGFGGQRYAAYAHQATKLQQIRIAQEVLKVQGPGAWPVCSVRAGLTLSNGLEPYPGGSTPAPDPGTEGTWWVSASQGANIRSGPSTSYPVVGGASRGTRITGSLSNGWVQIDGGRGWISAATLTTTDPGGSTPEPTPKPGDSATWRVTAGQGANIRSGPGTNYAVIGGARYGTTFTGSEGNGWVKLEGRSGWISASIMAQVSSGSGGGGSSDMAPLALDGSRGPLTTKAIQRWVGVSETGVWDTRTIKAVQAEIGTRADGYWGPMSQAALQSHIGISRDGSSSMNYRTVVGLQKWLNANVIG